ncbi:hypothetical protein [Shewanella gaetbuli]
MLTKILVTLLVIIGASFYLKRGRKPESKTAQIIKEQSSTPLFNRLMISSVIAVSLLATALYWGWTVYDENQVVTVEITSPIDAISAQYQVRKKDIKATKITTVDGVEVRLSNQERITISTQ